jgi:protein-tyrosine phosphatase
MTKVLFVCLGNICRSPMAQFVLKQMVEEKGLSEQFEIDSAATESYNEMLLHILSCLFFRFSTRA